jgi:hypothetical protein
MQRVEGQRLLERILRQLDERTSGTETTLRKLKFLDGVPIAGVRDSKYKDRRDAG